MLTLSCSIEEKIHVKLNPTTAKGNPGKFDTPPVWAVQSGAGTIEPDADSLGAFLVPADTFDGVDTVYMVDAGGLQDTAVLSAKNPAITSLGITADPAVPK